MGSLARFGTITTGNEANVTAAVPTTTTAALGTGTPDRTVGDVLAEIERTPEPAYAPGGNVSTGTPVQLGLDETIDQVPAPARRPGRRDWNRTEAERCRPPVIAAVPGSVLATARLSVPAVAATAVRVMFRSRPRVTVPRTPRADEARRREAGETREARQARSNKGRRWV